jgi:hypothetical protein
VVFFLLESLDIEDLLAMTHALKEKINRAIKRTEYINPRIFINV